ncbi:MAG TPA: hypothetical protein VEZ88_10250 [Steroidobacteraceae bacterium]|nr:hypothetical protein [Steroidobacteraceae bacterium]
MQIRPPSAPGTRSKDAVRGSNERPAHKETWHAVSIVTPTSTCEAASALRNHRFLSKDAPRLPLAGCSSPETCRCIYRHYADRRGKPRRGSDRGDPPKGGQSDTERRGRRGRRANDDPELE